MQELRELAVAAILREGQQCVLERIAAVRRIRPVVQKQLGDVVYLELPDVGRVLKKGEVFGTIESVKAVSELFTPMAGEVTEVNRTLTDRPEVVNSDPHSAWMIAIKLGDASDQTDLLDAGQYTELTQ